MGTFKLHSNLSNFRVKLENGGTISNSSYTSTVESFIVDMVQSRKEVAGLSSIYNLVSFAVSAGLHCGLCGLLEYILKYKVSYGGKQVSTAECDNLIAAIISSTSAASDGSTANRRTDVIHTILNHTTVTITDPSGSPRAYTMYDLCDLTTNSRDLKQWRHGTEAAVVQRLQDGAIIPHRVTTYDPPLHFSVRRALQTGSHRLFDYILSVSPAESMSEENQNHHTPLDVVARYACSQHHSDVEHEDVVTYVADRLLQKVGKPLTLQQYRRCVIDGDAYNHLCEHLVKKLKTKDLYKMADNTGWVPGCEEELITRLQEGNAKQEELQVDGSFLHFVIHVTLKSGSTRLLRYAFRNIFKSRDSIAETDSRGWNIMKRVQKQSDAPKMNRVVCLRTLLIYDHVNIYQELTDRQLEKIAGSSRGVRKNQLLKAMRDVKDFVDYRKQLGSSAEVRAELRERMNKALTYIGDTGESYVHFMHRTKSQGYFHDIMMNNDRMLKRTLKREWGSQHRQDLNQRGCPLNSCRTGTFFVCNDEIDMGFEEYRSPFGDTRLMIPLDEVLPYPAEEDKEVIQQASLDELGDLLDYNFYFADFYCVTVGKHHYVLIGVTEPDTEDDEFCDLHLLKLNPLDNPFFTIEEDGSAKCINKVWVYIFYMGDLRIASTTTLNETPEGAASKKAGGEEHFTKVTCLKSQRGKYRVSRRSGRRVQETRDEYCSVCHIGRQPQNHREQ